MKKLFLYASIMVAITSCEKNTAVSSNEVESQSEAPLLDSELKEGSFTQDDQSNIIRLLDLTLKERNKEGIEQGWIDSLSRTFIYSQIDLNNDGKKELFVGQTGPAFCGSGGCTVLLLDEHGSLITEFTVVDYPVFLDTEDTNGWKNLVMRSGNEFRIVTWGTTSYPQHPSLLDPYYKSTDSLLKVLDWEHQEHLRY